jgi:hypothetical protein
MLWRKALIQLCLRVFGLKSCAGAESLSTLLLYPENGMSRDILKGYDRTGSVLITKLMSAPL